MVWSLDPCEIALIEWSNAKERVPPVGYEDIVNYLLVRKSAHIKEGFKAVKSLGSHNQLTSD